RAVRGTGAGAGPSPRRGARRAEAGARLGAGCGVASRTRQRAARQELPDRAGSGAGAHMTVICRRNEWRIGDIKVIRIVEAEGLRAPEYMFRDLTPDMVRRHEWLRPDFATEEGQLISSIHAFVIEAGPRRIIVDTCVGNDKARRMPRWNMLQTT